MNKSVFGFLLSSLILSFGISFLNPIISLVLVNVKGVSPFDMGIFISIMTLLKIVTGHLSGIIGDNRSIRRKILFVSQFFNVIGLCGFLLLNNYWLLLCVVGPLLALGSMGSSHLMALGRVYSDTIEQKSATQLITWMRTMITVAWIVGPPSVFFIIEEWGFNWSLVLAMAFSVLLSMSIWFLIPNFEVKKPKREAGEKLQGWMNNGPLLAILFVNMFVSLADSLYAISMPLYLVESLHYEARWAGYIFGAAAGMEVIFTLLTGLVADRIGKERLVVMALISGVVFYGLLLFADSRFSLIAIQLFNAIFISVTTNLLIIIIQDKLSERPAMASTLYTNSMRVGNMFAGLIAGIVSQWFGFKSVFILSLFMALVGWMGMLWIRRSRLQAVHTGVIGEGVGGK
ncbi:sugar efflux transporter [Paenibacillus radicibacter]|uniref:sugar efflux transporter n=1 Tax=Paenibacillus radicibacter TaxID=2972488 RepID=UPI0021590CAE|nr:sugar efflux transporter [Paenibacillus radicibacter]